MRLDVALRGNKEVQAKMAEIGEHSLNLMPAFRHITDVLVHEEARRFRLGRSFEPLAPQTVARKQREGMAEPSKPMVGTGALRASLTRLRDPNQILEVRHDSLRFGTKLHYGSFHPERPPLELTRGGKGKANRTIRNWLLHGIATDKKVDVA